MAHLRPNMQRLIAVALATSLASLLLSNASAATPQPIRVETVCFGIVAPNGHPAQLFGRRYSVGRVTSATPVIVLVHGIDSSADTWDLTPQQSVARRLASAGYVVIAYDRLGFARSRYSGDPSGLTLAAQQDALHGLITDVHRGRYAASEHNRCQTGRTYPSRSVVIIAHSSGGLLVAGYPGRFHDVAAMVQANAPSGLVSLNPPGDAAVLSLLAAEVTPAHGAQDDRYGPIGSTKHDGAPPAAPPGYSNPLPTRSACEEFMLWRSGAIPAAATQLCNPRRATPTPQAEVNSYPQQILANQVFIRATGRVPVLLAGADHDSMMPGNANALELSAWRSACGCDVSAFVLSNTGHAFMAHRSLTTWITNVVTWLRSHGLR